MAKLWEGRFTADTDRAAEKFNSSIGIDSRMYKEDIQGSIAHAEMLGECGIIDRQEADKLVKCLEEILSDIDCGKLIIDSDSEDIHSFVEGELTKRLGTTGKRLHTARSRNDQTALDLRLNLAGEIKNIRAEIIKLVRAIATVAAKNTDTVMPGYTHLQRAQPVTFAHHILAYAAMLMRDNDRLGDALKRTVVSPLGSCAFAGTTYPINRSLAAQKLGFDDICFNSADGVSDRDFVVELCSAAAIIMMHLSRFSEEIILWASWEFKFIELSDAYSTGSSIMPQKKNPDIAELIRGKTGRAYGNLMAILTVMKGLPLAYNKDMQEDKECVFDSVDTVKACLSLFTEMLLSLKVNKANMFAAAEKGFINATDAADYLVRKGLAFRDSYKTVGKLVAYCIKEGFTLNNLPLEKYKEFSGLFESDVYLALDMKVCVEKRTSEGGPAKEAVSRQIAIVEAYTEGACEN